MQDTPIHAPDAPRGRRETALITHRGRRTGDMTSAALRWGILGWAKIATAKVIPAMQHAPGCEVLAIASRDGNRAREGGFRGSSLESHGLLMAW